MSELVKNFGMKLKQAREAKGLTQAALAEIVNIVPQYITSVENYGRLPSLTVFYKLVRACDLSVDDLFFPEKVQNAPLDDKKKRVMLKINLCPEEYFSVVEASVKATVDSLILIKKVEKK